MKGILNLILAKILIWLQHTPLILVCILTLFSEVIPSKWGLVMDRLMVLSSKFSDTLTHVQSFIWRVLELHIVKIVAYFVVWVALLEVCTLLYLGHFIVLVYNLQL